MINYTVSIFLFLNFVKGYGFVVAANPIKVKIVDIHICVVAFVKDVFLYQQSPVSQL